MSSSHHAPWRSKDSVLPCRNTRKGPCIPFSEVSFHYRAISYTNGRPAPLHASLPIVPSFLMAFGRSQSSNTREVPAQYPPIDPLGSPGGGLVQDPGHHSGSSSGHAYGSHGSSYYPTIPNLSDSPSAPPLPPGEYPNHATHYNQYRRGGAVPVDPTQQRAGPGVAVVATPKIEPQPWVSRLWLFLCHTGLFKPMQSCMYYSYGGTCCGC